MLLENRWWQLIYLVTAGVLVYFATTTDGPFDRERVLQLALVSVPVWLATKIFGWVSFIGNDFVKSGIVGVIFASPIAVLIFASTRPAIRPVRSAECGPAGFNAPNSGGKRCRQDTGPPT